MFETWVLLALSSALLFALANTLDKWLTSNVDLNALPLYTWTMGSIAMAIFFVLGGIPNLGINDYLLVITSGIISIFSMHYYFRAIAASTVSNVNIYFELVPLFVFCFATFILNESLSIQQGIGFFLVLSAVLMTYLGENILISRKVLVNVLIFNILTALSYIPIKYVSNDIGFINLMFLESVGIFIGGGIMFAFLTEHRKAFIESIHIASDRAKTYVIINEVIFLSAKGCIYYAFSIGLASLVSVLSSTQVFFALLLSIIGSCFSKSIKESYTTKNVVTKIIAFAMILIGISMLNYKDLLLDLPKLFK